MTMNQNELNKKIEKAWNEGLRRERQNPMRKIIGEHQGLVGDYIPGYDDGEEPISKGADPNYERDLEAIY